MAFCVTDADEVKKMVLHPSTQVEEVRKISEPVAEIACGGDYCFCCLQDSGTVLAWGRNSRGQLGVGDLHNRGYPSEVSALNPCNARACACMVSQSH